MDLVLYYGEPFVILTVELEERWASLIPEQRDRKLGAELAIDAIIDVNVLKTGGVLDRWKCLSHEELLGRKGINRVSSQCLFKLYSPWCVDQVQLSDP